MTRDTPGRLRPDVGRHPRCVDHPCSGTSWPLERSDSRSAEAASGPATSTCRTDFISGRCGASRLRQRGTELRWGPGRHKAGNNAFSYFVTPGGFAVEYTAELEEIDEASWSPHVYEPAPGIMDQWGTGVGGPQTMPRPEPDPALFTPAEI